MRYNPSKLQRTACGSVLKDMAKPMNVGVVVNEAFSDSFKPNKHGVMPVVLEPLSGKLPPNAGVVDGSIAERLKLKVGHRYIISIIPDKPWVDPKTGKTYQNYRYVVLTQLGKAYDELLSQKYVASVEFDFGNEVEEEPQLTESPVSV